MFLDGVKSRPVTLEGEDGLSEPRLYLGNGSIPLEIVVAEALSRPKRQRLCEAWKKRHQRRPAGLLMILLYQGRAWVCGPTGLEPPVYEEVDIRQLDRICRSALAAPNEHAAIRFLNSVLPQVETPHAGIINRGLLSRYVLYDSLPRKEWWLKACAAARNTLRQSDQGVLEALGFTTRPLDRLTAVLEAQDRQLAVAVLLRPEESPDQNLPRFNDFSPVSYAINVADRHNLRYVILVQNRMLRLYPAAIGIGVGQRGRTETYVEIHLDLLRDDQAGYLWSLFSAEALLPGGLLERLLKESERFAGDLARKFRERIYNEVVPRLAQGVAEVRHGRKRPSRAELAETYDIALTILFRLLFLAYAEDKDLLPYEWNDSYRKRSLKGLATELGKKVITAGGLAKVEPGMWDACSDALWEQVHRLCVAVEKGYRDWGVPIYNGRLFSSDPQVSSVGKIIDQLKLTDDLIGPVLCHLLLVGSEEGVGPVDFRSLSVREFGTIYEGLLESELSYAEQALVVDARTGHYRPLSDKERKEGTKPDVAVGQIYLHNRSGARKSTGSFYTKSFVVEHLLDEALEPALQEHLHRLDGLDDDRAAEAFFDFRVADIAMGSGHFLVAAIDRIERAFSQYLSKRPLPQVQVELSTLRTAALNELEKVGLKDTLGPRIEDNQLLRRLIARRCIYGVDLNSLAVDLARLSIWIHSFVPGLPLSFLEHNLIAGNSLTGIGTFEELADALGSQPLFVDPREILGAASEPLESLARSTDTTPEELTQARKAHQEALRRIQPAQALCDLVAAGRLEPQILSQVREICQRWKEEKDRLFHSRLHRQAQQVLGKLRPVHFPVAFPEVFLRERAGFDVILGNPPWQEATVEEHAFWARYEPGLRGLSQREQEKLKDKLRSTRPDLVALLQAELAEAEDIRKALVAGPYPGMGTGDPDLYKAFCWRFWQLTHRNGGRIGVVLPRTAWSAKGSELFRRKVFSEAESVVITALVNNRLWVFDDGHPQWTYALTTITLGKGGTRVGLRGPFASLEAFEAGRKQPPAEFAAAEVSGWTETAALPLLPTEMSLEVFARMRRHPPLGLDDGKSWRARPHTELHATNDKVLMDLDSVNSPPGYWPVYKGESFDLWQPDRGPDTYYAWADPEKVCKHLFEKRLRAARGRHSPFAEFDRQWIQDRRTLPCYHARIAFRDVARATDSRTVRVALIPPRVFVTNKAPFLLWVRGDQPDQAYLLGILSSVVLDWYARRFVETALNFHVFNPLAIPRPHRGNRLWQRVVQLAGRLAAIDQRLADWAKAVGVECGPLDGSTWIDMICELDAVVAHLYGLEEKHLRHIFETFHEGWEPGTQANHPTLGDFNSRLERTLEHFRRWRQKAQPSA
jgi:hypothetical protein